VEIDLLEYLALKCGFAFLSDLRFAHIDRDQMRTLSICIRRIPPRTCALCEWNDAVNYITSEDKRFRDEAAAKEYLLRYLNLGGERLLPI
jgi:hypothetical protein